MEVGIAVRPYELKKQRFSVQASSLGSYFGVGFNPPLEQLQIDLGNIDNEFDDEAERRMRLGRMLEDGVLNYFEEEFGAPITNRNTGVVDGLDGMLRVKYDGEMVYQGEPTIVEAKISNASYGAFTLSKGYILQCQAYMLVSGYSQALLLGLYLGKPIHRLIYRDEAIINDIKTMVEAVYGILNGILDESDFPMDLLAKYSDSPIEADREMFDEEDIEVADELFVLQGQIKELTERADNLKAHLTTKYIATNYASTKYSLSVSQGSRRGGVNEALLVQDNPTINLDDYRSEPSIYKTVRVTKRTRN